MAPRARVAKSKARLSAYEKLASQEYEEREDELVMQIPPGPHLGDLVVRAEGVRKGYGDNLLMEDLNFDLPRGGIVGIIGPNGAGKTTLFRMIVGQEKPDGGTLRVGETVVPAYVDQNRDALDGTKTVFEEITGGADHLMLGKRKVASRGYVSRFNFKGPDQQRKVGELSGGERNRVHLAKLLRRGGNLLLLDEPTNDLDVDTLRALEEALLNFGGCAVVISHDRWFLDRIATHILAFEGDSKTVWCEGNYQTYEAQRQQRLGRRGRPAAPHPLQEAASVRRRSSARSQRIDLLHRACVWLIADEPSALTLRAYRMMELVDVTKVYQQGRRRCRPCAGVSLSIAAGEFVSIMGPSGSGKSTLMHLLGALDTPTSGQALFQGRDLHSCPTASARCCGARGSASSSSSSICCRP